MKKYMLFSASLLLAFSACSDDESSSSPDVTDSSSSTEIVESSSSEKDTLNASSSSTVVGKGILIDDLEDGDSKTLLESYWYAFDDKDNGGASAYSIATDSAGEFIASSEGYESKYAFKVSYTLDKGSYEYAPYVGFGFGLPVIEKIGSIGGLSYWYRGGAHTVRLETSDVTDYDVHGVKQKASRVWKQAVVRFQDVTQEGWGIEVPFNPVNIMQISFHISGDKITDSLEIDNVYFMDTSEVAKDEPDMTIQAPQIPKVNIDPDSIAITNPLQEKAMKYLDKGVNFTNWLEQNKFTGFENSEYGKLDVKALGDNGFKSLRLPIDLDLYVSNRDEFVKGADPKADLIIEDTLWTILDSFVNWTKEYNLSFTIDYHEYDGSYNTKTSADPMYRTMMAKLWKSVAARYSKNAREDIFYELLNEPGMNSNGKIVQSDWTLAAQEMIDSIRTVDSSHTILFGDVQWYDIDKLIKREPFADDNIIYVIHCYEPFVFTHQGASWGETATIRNIPFPYDSSKWSTYSADFGVKKNTASWVKSAVKTYYKIGNKETIINKILPAKKWAARNNVPVIINEYGAYNLRSDAESILNYLTAMRELSDTLQIPLQHWGYAGGFALFNSDRTLIDGVDKALDLK